MSALQIIGAVATGIALIVIAVLIFSNKALNP